MRDRSPAPGGGSSWTAKGTKGWNSPVGKQHDDPESDPTLKSRAKADLKIKQDESSAVRAVGSNMGGKRAKDPFPEELGEYATPQTTTKDGSNVDVEELPGNDLEFLKNPTTGAALATYLGFGGRSPPRLSKAGYRGYGRK